MEESLFFIVELSWTQWVITGSFRWVLFRHLVFFVTHPLLSCFSHWSCVCYSRKPAGLLVEFGCGCAVLPNVICHLVFLKNFWVRPEPCKFWKLFFILWRIRLIYNGNGEMNKECYINLSTFSIFCYCGQHLFNWEIKGYNSL